MKTIRTAVAALVIVLVVVTGTRVGVAQWKIPLDFSNGSKPPIVCKPFTTELEARSAGAWAALDIVHDDPPDRAERVQAELERLGGARLVLEVDENALRKEMLEEARDDIRRAVREARLGSPAAVIIRGGTIEFNPRPGVDAAAVSDAFAPLLSGTIPALVSRGVDDERAARGVVAFAVSDLTLAERRQNSEQVALDTMDRRLRHLGVATPMVQALGGGRILMITPGFDKPERMWQLLPSTAKLTFQIADRSADPCAADMASNSDSALLRHYRTKTSVLVQRRVLAGGTDVAAVAVVRDGRTGASAVALRFNTRTTSRLAQASTENIGQAIAIVLDGEVIDAPIIREPIVDGSVRLSGGLTLERAKELAMLLRAGRLPLPLNIVEQQIVEPRR